MPDNTTCICGERKKPQYQMCYVCTAKANGKKLCPKCNKGWFDPAAYSHCWNCNNPTEETPTSVLKPQSGEIQRLIVDKMNELNKRLLTLEQAFKDLNLNDAADTKKEEILFAF